MYLHTDFVTHMPIQENQKVILFFIAKPTLPRYLAKQPTVIENMSYIDTTYQPISIPFVARYGEHGDFILDPNHTTTNSLAWFMLKTHQANEDMALPTTITEHNYREIFNENIRNNVAISVTDYNHYQTATEELMFQPVRQGVFTRDETYAKDYENRKQALINHAKTMEPHDDTDVLFSFAFRDLKPLVQPNMIQSGQSTRIQNEYRIDQLEISQITNVSIHLYYNQWGIFQKYLEMIRVPFSPVTGLGSQSDYPEIYSIYAREVTQQAKNLFTRTIQSIIENEYELLNEAQNDQPEFVTYYQKLAEKYNMQIDNDEDPKQIKRFANALTLDELEKWVGFTE